jgi:hypothetical protein
MPIRNTNCVAKLISFERKGYGRYEAKAGANFVTYAEGERAVFRCASGPGCDQAVELSVYVTKQLASPALSVFGEIQYKFTPNALDADIEFEDTIMRKNRDS